MNTIETAVPISIENLKIYFENKETLFKIDYDNSLIKGEKFLIYLSNLDLPCDIKFLKNKKEHLMLLVDYLKTKHIVSLPSLEKECLDVFLEMKKIENNNYSEFILENEEILSETLNLIESLSLYNFYCIQSDEFKEFVESHPKKANDNLGYNFVNLIKQDKFNLIFQNLDRQKLYFYEDFFKNYMFKGKNLYYYWANETNPLFLLTWGIANGLAEKYFEQGTESNVTPV